MTVTDSLGGTDTETFTWTVVNLSNNPPLIVDPPSQFNAEGDTVFLQIQASDTDGDPLAYSATGLPPGLMIDELIGAIRGTIAPTAFGVYSVIVAVTDGFESDHTSFTWAVTTGTVIDYPDFSDVTGWQFNGSAVQVFDVIRLADDRRQRGTAFYTAPWSLTADTAFSTRFDFRIHGRVDGGDGMTFMIQGNEPTILGGQGGSLGYRGIGSSLAVEIDNQKNNASGDVNGNHIGLLIDGDVNTHLAIYTPPFDLEDGFAHTLWVDSQRHK